MTGRWKVTIVVAAVVLMAVASYVLVPRFTTISVEADFTSTTGLYVGDDVRIMGVDVGTIESIEPRGDHTVVRFSVDSSYSIPAQANAVIVSQSLVASRFVQLAPAYTGGDRMSTGAHIPLERTAVPVEWDKVKEQLARVAGALSPAENDTAGPLGDLVNAADANLSGRGENLHTTLDQLSEALKTLSDGRTDLFAIVRNLQIFVSALAQSGQQIVQFNDRLASVGQVLDANTDQIGSALATLDTAVGEVESFVRDNRDAVTTNVQALQEVVGELASQRTGLEQVLHVLPTALSNLNNIYQPAHNAIVSALAPNNFANPMDFICSALAAAEQLGAREGAELCVQYLGPLLKTLSFDYLPLSANPIRGVGALPDQLVYSEPQLAPRPQDLNSLLVPGGVR
jgi:phospholipid/cholesterol/gamma-HCH transport system substrate-binding protein